MEAVVPIPEAFFRFGTFRRFIMLKHITTGGHFTHPVRRALAIITMLAMTICAASTIVSAEAVYVIYDGDTCTTVESRGYTTAAVLKNAGIEVDTCDQVTSQRNERGTTEITISRAQSVAINYQGATLHVYAHDETIRDLLARIGIAIGVSTVSSLDLDIRTEDGMVIDVTTYTYKNVVEEEAIPYATERKANASLTKGKENVLQAGKDGTAEVTYYVTYANGEEISRRVVSSKEITPATTEIVEYGTKAATIERTDRIASDERSEDGSGVLTFQSGDTVTYSRVLTANATAYTAKAGSKTASGKTVYVGGIAVDPKVIPLGTKMYIQTTNGKFVYGTATAIDTGGAIKGNKIDLFFSTYNECVQFGRRNCTVYILN